MSTKLVRPVTPKEVSDFKLLIIPDEVISAFNELITFYYNDGVSTFKQSEVISLIKQKLSKSSSFEIKWLNIESLYEDIGWNVKYDKPAYNENYPATFTFKVEK